MEEEFGFSINFFQGGYLLLAYDEELLDVFKKNIKVQKAEGINVSLLPVNEVAQLIPQLNTEGIHGAAYCSDDAEASSFLVINGYKNLITRNQGDFYLYNPVIMLKKDKHFVLTLGDGTTINSEKVLLSAGAWTGEIAKTQGIDLPLFPERHEALITEKIPGFIKPMIVDYRKDGCYFQQLTTGQIIGCYTPDPNVPGIITETSIEFLPRMAYKMTRLIPQLGKASVLRHWAGLYTMTPDGNPIVDSTPLEGLYVACGMSGHGFMFGPAVGKNLADFMASGSWKRNFDEFSINREFKGTEKLK